jgi:signal transduction histidine kinase
MQLPRLDSFIPSIQVIVSISSLITAVLLFGQFSIGSRGVLVLAGGYLFVSLIVISHIFTFPGAFSPTGLLGAGMQSAAWLYIFWHFGFPIAVIGYVFLKDKSSVRHSAFSAISQTVVIVIALVCFLTWIATAEEQVLPILYADTANFARRATYATGADLFLSALALVLLWRRGWSVLDVWLSVTICAFMADLVINTLLISSRFTLGWYSARAFSVLVSTMVMILMFAQTFALNSKLLRATVMLQRERSNKLATLEAVAVSISHEVRQPLTTIAMRGAAAQRYLNRTPLDLSKLDASVRAMVDAGMRANEILTSIRALFSNIGDERKSISVNELIAEALDLLHEELNVCGIEVDVRPAPDLPTIVAHRGQLLEVFLNLIQNAVDAMKAVSERGRILRIETRRSDQENIEVLVEDSGLGIDPEKLKSIFEPFFSTKPKGTGLGLAICKSIVERHSGRISVFSERDGGARFELVLPITAIAQQDLQEGLSGLGLFELPLPMNVH